MGVYQQDEKNFFYDSKCNYNTSRFNSSEKILCDYILQKSEMRNEVLIDNFSCHEISIREDLWRLINASRTIINFVNFLITDNSTEFRFTSTVNGVT